MPNKNFKDDMSELRLKLSEIIAEVRKIRMHIQINY